VIVGSRVHWSTSHLWLTLQSDNLVSTFLIGRAMCAEPFSLKSFSIRCLLTLLPMPMAGMAELWGIIYLMLSLEICNTFATADTISVQFSKTNFPQQQLTNGSLHQPTRNRTWITFRRLDTKMTKSKHFTERKKLLDGTETRLWILCIDWFDKACAANLRMWAWRPLKSASMEWSRQCHT